MLLEGKRAVITGGGRGIGRGIAERFADEGAQLAVVQRGETDPALLERGNVRGVRADLSDPAGLGEVVDGIARELGGIDVLINNAGIMFERDVEQITVAEWDLMMSLNLRTPMFLIQAALPHLRRAGGGSIVNIGSIEGLGANPGHAAYSAAKAGLHGLTRAVAVDLGADGIRCNAIAPGWIATELSETYLDSMPQPATARENLRGLHPVGRVGQASDVGDLAVFLASERSGFVTGETIVIDGGRTTLLPQPR